MYFFKLRSLFTQYGKLLKEANDIIIDLRLIRERYMELPIFKLNGMLVKVQKTEEKNDLN